MSDLRELYQSVILDHNKRPRNFGPLEGANRSVDGFNPLCGDKVTVYANVQDGVVKGVSFEGSGCAISTASASLMTQRVKGMSIADFEKLFAGFHRMVTAEPSADVDAPSLGKLAVLGGVREFPMRVKCATLAWHALRSALTDSGEAVTTE